MSSPRNLELQFTSMSVGSFIDSPRGINPSGTRLNPGLRLNLDWFFAEASLETGVFNEEESPIGIDYYDAHLSHGLTPTSPFVFWSHHTAVSPLRALVGFRSLSVGVQFSRDLQLRIGPHYYEQTEYENMFTHNIYTAPPDFTKFFVPLSFGNTELRYSRERETGLVRQLTTSLSVMVGADHSVQSIFQGLISLGIDSSQNENQRNRSNERPRSSLLSFVGYLAYRRDTHTELMHATDPGNTWGLGIGAYLEHGIFQGGVAYNLRNHQAPDLNQRELIDHRSMLSIVSNLDPGIFRFHAGFYYFTRAFSEAPFPSLPIGISEIHTEINAGIEFIENWQISLGYRAAFGNSPLPSHMIFIGMQTSLEKMIPF